MDELKFRSSNRPFYSPCRVSAAVRASKQTVVIRGLMVSDICVGKMLWPRPANCGEEILVCFTLSSLDSISMPEYNRLISLDLAKDIVTNDESPGLTLWISGVV